MNESQSNVTLSEVRQGAYYDSVVLMQLQRALADEPGVMDAGVVMATPANLDLLAASNLATSSLVGPDDLLIVVRARDTLSAEKALARVDELLTRKHRSSQVGYRPKSFKAAINQMPFANWALVSVPGRYAANVSREALENDVNVFLYSDNVSLKDEIALKETASDKGLMVMGPDCGTAIIDGIGFGFANRVRRGSIGMVAASGTGLQAISSTIHNLGAGISQAFGTGGRDLKAGVNAITTRQGLAFLANDPQTGVIVLISKPPEPAVATQVLQAALRTNKPVVIYLIGLSPPADQLSNLYFASSLGHAARLAVLLVKSDEARDDSRPADSGASPGFIRGLFSGGTLAYEVLQGLRLFLAPLYSNIQLAGVSALEDATTSKANTIIDMGEDEFTQGRLHPMMDNDLRIRRIIQEAADPEVNTILLDVVLGEAAHPDPASELAPVISKVFDLSRVQEKQLEVCAIVVGTDKDPQNLERQVQALQESGARVFHDPIESIDYLLNSRRSNDPENIPDKVALALKSKVAGINLGLELFYDSLKDQGSEVIHVDWRPPAGGNEKLMALLGKMKSE